MIESGMGSSNWNSILDQFFNMDPNRVLMGVFEGIPQISIPDPLLSHYIAALECLLDYDIVLHKSRVL